MLYIHGIEKDVTTALDEYYNSYPVITDNHITEAMKLEYWIPKVKELLPKGFNEVQIENDDFIGFIDYLVPVEKELKYNYKDNYETGYEWELDINSAMDNTEYYDLYDFKYSNNITSYLKSGQLHEYKYYFEKLNPGKKIRKLFFIFIPKCNLRIKYQNKTNPRDETIYEFRQRVLEYMKTQKIEIREVTYNPYKVIDFLSNANHCINDKEFRKNETRLCDWCEFKKYCQEGIDYEI